MQLHNKRGFDLGFFFDSFVEANRGFLSLIQMQVEALNSDVSRRYRDENVNFYYSRTLRFFLSVKNNNVKCLICVLFNLLKMINVSA